MVHSVNGYWGSGKLFIEKTGSGLGTRVDAGVVLLYPMMSYLDVDEKVSI